MAGFFKNKLSSLGEKLDNLTMNMDQMLKDDSLSTNKLTGMLKKGKKKDEPTASVETLPKSEYIGGVRVCLKGLLFTGQDWRYGKGLNQAFQSYLVTGGEGSGEYKKVDYGASKIIKELADKAGFDYKSTWSSSKIGEELLRSILKDNYKEIGDSNEKDVCNHVILDDYLLETVQQGVSWKSESYTYLYKKQ